MRKVSVVYHSGYGHTEAQARAVAAGAASVPDTEAALVRIESAGQDFEPILARLEDSDAILFGAPTYMGSISAPLKAFMEATSRVWLERKWADKLAGGFTNSASQNGDKLNSLFQLAVFAAQHGMNWISLGLLPGNNSSKGSPDDLNRLGSFIGAMAQSPADLGPEQGPSASDLRTAEHLGRRVAEAAHRWNAKPEAEARAA